MYIRLLCYSTFVSLLPHITHVHVHLFVSMSCCCPFKEVSSVSSYSQFCVHKLDLIYVDRSGSYVLGPLHFHTLHNLFILFGLKLMVFFSQNWSLYTNPSMNASLVLYTLVCFRIQNVLLSFLLIAFLLLWLGFPFILSCRSFICSSLLFNLLFIAFSSAFITAMSFLIFLGSSLFFLVPFYINLYLYW